MCPLAWEFQGCVDGWQEDGDGAFAPSLLIKKHNQISFLRNKYHQKSATDFLAGEVSMEWVWLYER